jgi:crotonobetaine/carnitine-CoA ligase
VPEMPGSPTHSESTLGKLLHSRAAQHPDQLFAYYNDQTLTYSALYLDACKAARGLHELGITKGDKVAILMHNCLEYVAAWFGIAMLGAVEVPINFNCKGLSLAYALRQSDSKALLMHDTLVPAVVPLQDRVENLQQVIIVSREIGTLRQPVWSWETLGWDELMTAPPDPPSVQVAQHDLMAIMYTSGSTGPAKGVMLPHRYALHFAEQKVRHMKTGPDDCIFNCYPMFNATGQFETTLPAMIASARVAHVPRFSARTFWDQIRRYSATEFVYMGGILTILFKQPERPSDYDNPVRAAYGVPTPPDIHRAFERRFGLKLIEVYGSTEAGVVTYNPYDDNRVGACGKPTAGYEITIADDDDRELATGEAGEILVRPRQPFIMLQGYYKMPERTLKAFRNLWYHSGDLGHVDDDGFLYFAGRKDDRIRRLGYNISPAEIESICNTHPQVLDSAALGLPGESGEEDVLLVVLPREGCQPDPASLFNFCVENLPYYMAPRFIRYVEEFPRTPTMRVEKYRLKEEGIAPGCWDSVAAGLVASHQ